MICIRLLPGEGRTSLYENVNLIFFWTHRRGEALRMPLESYSWLSQDVDALSKLAKLMRNTLHLAIALSPLVVLQPRKFSEDNI